MPLVFSFYRSFALSCNLFRTSLCGNIFRVPDGVGFASLLSHRFSIKGFTPVTGRASPLPCQPLAIPGTPPVRVWLRHPSYFPTCQAFPAITGHAGPLPPPHTLHTPAPHHHSPVTTTPSTTSYAGYAGAPPLHAGSAPDLVEHSSSGAHRVIAGVAIKHRPGLVID